MKEDILPNPEKIKISGSCRWQSPSNIALVKYWGKKHEQIPGNPSISFTLQNSYTITHLEWNRKQAPSQEDVEFTFHFHGQENANFSARIQKYLNRIAREISQLKNYRLFISSVNTFPHSSGIASSASAMSALAAALTDMERNIMEEPYSEINDFVDFDQRVSYFSRLGSGSGCRSVYPNAALWGKCGFTDSSDQYAVGLESILHREFHGYRDAILLVDRSEKKVSSTAGHQLMNQNPYAGVRYAEAYKNTETLLSILRSGNLDDFTSLVESEAMTLHALMMASSPGFILIHPNTLFIIDRIIEYRHDTGIPLCFTLDAGPNVHVLYPERYAKTVTDFILSDLIAYTVDGQWIDDKMGIGLQKLK